MAVRDVPDPGARGFTTIALRSLGGLDGAMERYLLAQLSHIKANEKAALAVLLLLSTPQEHIPVSLLPAIDIIERLGPEYGVDTIRKMIVWLSSQNVRLVIETDTSDDKYYRLVHDRLAAAVRKTSGQILEEAYRANQKLTQRTIEFLNNQRSSRFLLTRSETLLMRRNWPLIQWGSLEADKVELISRSAKRLRRIRYIVTGVALTLVIVLAIRECSNHVLLCRIEGELDADIKTDI